MSSAVPESSAAGSAAATPAAASSAAAISKDRITVGSKAIVCQDADLRGEISIGAGCVLHPRCTIFAYAGPIILGECCIVEETAIIVNRSKEPMIIGAYNLFEVGCRIEAQSIGAYNTFEAKARVSSSITVGDYCTIGAGCTVVPDRAASVEDWQALEVGQQGDGPLAGPEVGIEKSTLAKSLVEYLPDYTVVYGSGNERRIWSGEGKLQQTALMHKHLAYLSETLPKYSRLKLFT